MDSSDSLHSYESESEFDIALRQAKGADQEQKSPQLALERPTPLCTIEV